MIFRSGLQMTRLKSSSAWKFSPSRMASSVAYSRVSSMTWVRWPGMVATGSSSPKASTVWLVRLDLAV